MSPRTGKPAKHYSSEERLQFSELVRQHGARATRELCKRNVALPTLLKIAQEFGIELKKGRRPRKAA